MHSLFLKIFLWFWLAIGLVGLVLVITVAVTQSRPDAERWRFMTGSAMGIYAETAAEVYERDGRPGLILYLERVERATRIRAVMYDERGEEMSGRPSPSGTREVAERARNSNDVEFQFLVGTTLIARRTIAPDKRVFILAGEMPEGQSGLLGGVDFSTLALRLLAVVLTGGLVCYALARYITAPLARLRGGVRQLASGDLSIRVAPKMRGRRDELAELGRDFDRMAERIESLVLAQQRLLADISHELRSPLARMAVALELARQAAGPDAQVALDRIDRESERLNNLIGQLLTLTRLEIDTEEPQKTEVSLSNILREVVTDADFEAQSHHRSVRITDNEDCVVLGSEELLRSAIENVVRNAVRYTAKDTSVEIALRCSLGEGERSALVTVRDHGEGVPEKNLEDLFRPFYRVANDRGRQTGGTGLGLAITERAIKLHGGVVKAANAPGGGLVVEMRIPLGR